MSVRLRTQLQTPNIVPMATMADVAFLLIIFFMLTSTFARDTGLDITLPKALSSESLPKNEVRVQITRLGQIYVDRQLVPPDRVRDALAEALSKTSLQAVTVQGDEHVPYGTVVTVMDAAKLCGANITLEAELVAAAE